MTTTSQRVFEKAIDAHRRGAIEEARSCYREVLRLDPGNAAACGNLAIIAAQHGDLLAAEDLFRRGIKLRPDYPAGYNHLGTVLQQQGKSTEAIAAHRHAIRLDPNYAEAHLALGNALKQERDFDGAMRCYRAAVAVRPGFAEAHNNAGVVLQMQGRFEEAAAAYRRAAAARPDYAEALFNLGSVLHQNREFEAAEAAYRQAIAIDPKVAVAYNNLGTVLKDQGGLEAALEAFECALRLRPDYAEAHFNCATVLQQQGRLEDALAAYGHAIALRPDYIDAANNVGIVLQELGRAAEAIDLYRRLSRPIPAHAGLYNNLGAALLTESRFEEARLAFEQALACRPEFAEAAYNLGNAWRELGRLTEALAAWQQALELRPDYGDAFGQLVHHRALACQWDSSEADQQQLLAMVRSGVRIPPFYLLATPASAADQLLAAEQWIAPIRPPQNAQFAPRPGRVGGRIRLGYLSGDFHQHATAQLTAGLFERHDRNRFEVAAYSYGPDDGSPMRARLAQAFDRFVDVRRLSHREAADRIYRDEVDILIDLKGYTHGARPMICAFRPAPLQVSYLGYPATTGTDFIDYILVDRFVVPQSQQACFSEQLVHLPVCYQANDPRRDPAVPTARGDWGLPEQELVLCCFNNSYKLSPRLFDVWMRLLNAAPGSVLWLLATSSSAEANLRKEAEVRGINSMRLVFAPIVPLAVHLERHRHADLFLDTAPCNAHTTASDALSGALPVLTLSGDTFAGRVAGSLLAAIGMPELITTSLEGYEAAALALIREPDRLGRLRRKIEQKHDVNSLSDLARLTVAIEGAYERMWQRRLSGEKPQPFAIEIDERTEPC
jgi:predicted O-linked N-acetylglucosamine transferase (SPINDLY family)